MIKVLLDGVILTQVRAFRWQDDRWKAKGVYGSTSAANRRDALLRQLAIELMQEKEFAAAIQSNILGTSLTG